MKKQIMTFFLLTLLFIAMTQSVYPQSSGRRYTFIAKDGSQIINVYLVEEKENTYIIQISDTDKKIIISKKSIEKLIQTDSVLPEQFKPVIGKKSEIIQPADSDLKQDNTGIKGDYYLSLGLSGYGNSSIDNSKSYSSGGWGAEFLSILGFNKINYFQTGLGLNYNQFNSSIPEQSSSISLYCLFTYFQISYKPEILSFDNLYLRPYIGADLGGALLYKYNRSEDVNIRKTYYPKEPYYGFRLGFGINPINNIPVELLLSFQYSVIADNDINNFMKFSLGINYYFR